MKNEQGIIVGIVKTFLTGRLSIMLIIAALILGIGSVLITPREEEPQIVVPVADIFVHYPGASAEEVEKLVSTKLEKLLCQIDGVEYVYSTSYKDLSVVTVRFFVGEDRERSLIKLYNKIQSNIDSAVSGIKGWLIKPVEIDDVPIVTFSIFSDKLNDHELRRITEEINERIAQVEDISRTEIVGGRKREIRIELDHEKLSAKNISSLQVYEMLRAADSSISAGSINNNNKVIELRSGPFFKNIAELQNVVIGLWEEKTVKLSDIAAIIDGPEEFNNYTRTGFAQASGILNDPLAKTGKTYPSITLSVSKKKGTNAVNVAQNVIKRMEQLKKEILPSNVSVIVTRNYGETADEKVNNLLSSLFFAMAGVIILIIITMSWREAIIVALAVPISFSLSLFVNYMSGYTINRVTLFALILSLGLVVDDPITNVDNIQRHIAMKKKDPKDATLFAVEEVLPPVIMSTLAIIVSFLPMFFITGMMGPYMSPMAINVPLTVTFSTLCALTFVPWAAYHLLKKKYKDNTAENNEKEGVNPFINRIYRAVLEPFLNSGKKRIALLIVTFLLMAFSGLLIIFRKVPLKMLPFDNKNEFQIIVDPPEGTTLEQTDRIVKKIELFLYGVHEITSFQSYVGNSSPIDFNGMMRHYYLRKGPHYADIRVNFAPKSKRTAQSHDIVLRVRNKIKEIEKQELVNIKIVEVPPGPPVFSTIVAEIYGKDDTHYSKLIKYSNIIKERIEKEPFVVDVDTTITDEHTEIEYKIDRKKASLHGITTEQINTSLRLALSGLAPAHIHNDSERNLLNIKCIFAENKRSHKNILENIKVRNNKGSLVSIGELGEFIEKNSDQPIYHKNLKRVIYISAETAGRAPGEAVLDMMSYFKENPLPDDIIIDWAGEGEWKITLDVFRDLGIAFGVALIGMYLLIVLETNSFFIPIIIMSAIPLTAIGIMPGFYLLNLFNNRPIDGFSNPVFFTATAMIGMIALGGIVVRNSIVLIEFIQEAIKNGTEFKEAILQSGAVRFRPIMLTAGTTLLGAWPITLDPVFSGLAWSLIFGLFASTAFTMIIIPTIYYMIFNKKTV